MLILSIVILTTGTQTSFALVHDINCLTTLEIIRYNGYNAEVHNVVTDDGYILELHRIPKSESGKLPTRNHAVLIHHGFMGSSVDWVIGGNEQSLAMQLADAGFDVWLANSRGTTCSKNHETMSQEEKAFWDFSLHEVGVYDLPAVIDYILMKTETRQLHYVGFSFGTTVFFIMASEKPEYQSKIRSQISLAPVAYLSNTESVSRFIAPYYKSIYKIIQSTEHGMVTPQIWEFELFENTLCKIKFVQKYLCKENIIPLACGSDFGSIDKRLEPVILEHYPTTTSSKSLAHYAQFILKDTFARYDYGKSKNKRLYKSSEPPSYDLSSIQVPITLFYGDNDKVTVPEDVMKLALQLPQLISVIPAENLYCHMEFMWGVNVKERINYPVMRMLRETDDSDWVYKPRSDPVFLPMSQNTTKLIPLMIDGNQEQEETNNIIAESRSQNPSDGLKYKSILMKSMEKFSTGFMTKADDDEKSDFDQQQKLKKLRHLVKNIKFSDLNNNFGNNSPNDIFDSSDDDN